MDLYTGSLILGTAGLGLMALGGVAARAGATGSHGGHTGHSGHAGHTGHVGPSGHSGALHGHGGPPGGHVAHSASSGHAGAPDGAHGGHDLASGAAQLVASAQSKLSDRLGALLSPRLWFSVLVGFGTTGIILRGLLGAIPVVGPIAVLAAAVAGGVLFELLLVGPFWNFLFRFASNPALTLESALTDTAMAVTGFDANGQGLIAVDVDGQVVQVLASLRADDRGEARRVRAGEMVRIEEVDTARGRCVVSIVR
ncbi:MAG: hypothetical protein NTZ43_04285 [Gemmatimonadetes bacterium]|nr:hypothetical protein [Gemmatimonadota bacterium]